MEEQLTFCWDIVSELEISFWLESVSLELLRGKIEEDAFCWDIKFELESSFILDAACLELIKRKDIEEELESVSPGLIWSKEIEEEQVFCLDVRIELEGTFKLESISLELFGSKTKKEELDVNWDINLEYEMILDFPSVDLVWDIEICFESYEGNELLSFVDKDLK